MNRIIYVAGVNRIAIAKTADIVPDWLLSVTLLRNYPHWLQHYLGKDRNIRWDPGTFSPDPVSYAFYRGWVDYKMRSKDEYFQYDEINDHEITTWYLKDMRRRGYNPIPILQPGGDETMLTTEKRLGIGALVHLSDEARQKYLDHLFYDYDVTAECHLLGMIKHEWFSPYKKAVKGDNTSHIQRSEWNRRKTPEEWMLEYGKQWIPFKERQFIQMAIGF